MEFEWVFFRLLFGAKRECRHFHGCGEETQIPPHTWRIISRAASAAPAASFLPTTRSELLAGALIKTSDSVLPHREIKGTGYNLAGDRVEVGGAPCKPYSKCTRHSVPNGSPAYVLLPNPIGAAPTR